MPFITSREPLIIIPGSFVIGSLTGNPVPERNQRIGSRKNSLEEEDILWQSPIPFKLIFRM